jgi:hydroxymethylglutaryl-CoA lyase
MQGWKSLIPTEKKIAYLNKLLEVGFDTLDCGSFVSAKAIPQMADTAAVLPCLRTAASHTKLLVIVANVRGAEEAVAFNSVTYLGFPFSVSPTFQVRNTNSTIEESLKRVEAIQSLCNSTGKELVVYLSMGFGNPYGDDYNEKILLKWADAIVALGVKTISVADTVGVASPSQISAALNTLIPKYKNVQIGVHLHSSSANFREKLKAAANAACKRFDGALKGIGGCPMANDELVGNMNSEWMINYFKEHGLLSPINERALTESIIMAEEIFAA